jgi:hypothetical protein
MHEFPGPHDRIRRVLETALTGCTYVSTQSEGDGTLLVLQARKPDGRGVGVRFRAVKSFETNVPPETGAPITVKSVKRHGVSFVSRFFPLIKPPGPAYARARIHAGPATLEVVCQDAEWWEE